MELKWLQQKIEEVYHNQALSEQPSTLTLGVVEEVGELAELILYFTCSDFKSMPRKIDKFSHVTNWKELIAHEIGDVIVYLLAICNALQIEPQFSDKFREQL